MLLIVGLTLLALLYNVHSFVFVGSRILAIAPRLKQAVDGSNSDSGEKGKQYSKESEHAHEQQQVVEVYSTLGCKYCRKAKAVLTELGVPYDDIDVQDLKFKIDAAGTVSKQREERVAYTKTTTVPQIYIGATHLGGCTELLVSIENDTIERILAGIGIKLNPIQAKEQAKEDTDTDVVLRQDEDNEEEEEAEEEEEEDTNRFVVGDALNQIITTISKNTDEIQINHAILSQNLQKQSLTLTDEFVTPDGKLVDYKRMNKSKSFREYVKLSSQLQHVSMADIRSMTDAEKIAFFSNLYNAMIIHAYCVLGPPADTPAARSAFFSGASGARYLIAGHSWSPDDIEHGLLRANLPHPSQPQGAVSFLPLADERASLSISRASFDPRVHFILNCGAESCPPIKIIDSDNLEVALAGAARAYLASEVAVGGGGGGGVVRLPKLLLWYGRDFGVDMLERLKKVCVMLPEGSTRARLQERLGPLLGLGSGFGLGSELELGSELGLGSESELGELGSELGLGLGFVVEYGEYSWTPNAL